MFRILAAVALVALVAVPSFAIDLNPSTDFTPLLASDGSAFFAVWTERSNFGDRVLAVRFTDSGVVIDKPALIIGSGRVLAVAFGASEYLVLWADGSGIAATRMSQNGTKIDETPLRIDSATIASPAVAFNGQRFFITWISEDEVYGIFLTPDGHRSERQKLASAGTGGPTAPEEVAWDGKRFLVIWSKYGFITSPIIGYRTPVPAEVEALRVAADGTPLDAAPTPIVTTGNIEPLDMTARIASSGSDFLVTVTNRYASGYIVSARFVDAESTPAVRSSIILSNLFAFPSSAVVWTGSDYMVTWTYSTTGTAEGAPAIASARMDRAGRVTRRFLEIGSTGAVRSAVNRIGEVATGISENPGVAHAYLDREISRVMPFEPGVPAIVATPPTAAWVAHEPVDGFAVESVPDVGEPYVVELVPASRTSVDATFTNRNRKRIRVRAFNAYGLSEPSATVSLVDVPASRHRPVHH